jgi:hypothetical protein
VHLLGLIIFLLIPFASKTQDLSGLYDKALHGRDFIYGKPLTLIDFEICTFHVVFEGYIDSLQYQQILVNSKNADSSLWTNQEVGNQIIVNEDEPMLNWEKVKEKFSDIDEKAEKRYKKEIDYYNNNPQDRVIYRISRPVFDNKKEYAVIQYHLKIGNSLKLFSIKNGEWNELFTIVPWY